VSIAVACARRAEDALEHAREVSATARRRMSVVAAITGFTVIAAAAAVWFDRHGALADPRMMTEAAAASGHGTDPRPVAFGTDAMVQAVDQRSARTGPADVVAVSAPVPEHDVAPARLSSAGPAAMSAPASGAASAPAPVTYSEARPVDPLPLVTQTAGPAAVRASEPLDPAQTTPFVQPRAADVATAAAPAETRSPDSMPPRARPPEPIASPVEAQPVRPPTYARTHQARPAVYREARVYRPVRRAQYYIPSPPVVLAQVVADVRRNLFAIFH
jgi:hypothetical protein